MVSKIIMPALGQTVGEVTINRWHKHEGDRVQRGDILLEVTTDKADVEVESFASGVLRRVLFPEGAVVPSGTVIAVIAEEGEELPADLSAWADLLAEAQPTAAETLAPTGPPIQAPPAQPVKASPLAKRIAAERGISLEGVIGTGPDGLITKEDVLKAATVPTPAPKAAPPKEAPPTVVGQLVPMTRMRKAIAQRMVLSKTTIPHFYMSIDVDMSETAKLREVLNQELARRGKAKLSYNAFLVKAAARALEEFPVINSQVEGDQIRQMDEINIGIAVALEEGLIAPVLRHANRKSLLQLGAEGDDLTERARKGGLKAGEVTGGTFTITNAGMYGVESFTAIINPPESAILAVGRIAEKPVALQGQVVIRTMMTLVLSADHRVVDGAIAASFLRRLRELLEQPQVLMIE